jgi:alanine racemase
MGMIKPQNFKTLAYRNFAFVVQDEATIRMLGSLKRKCRVHLEIDTGMHRNGIAPVELAAYLKLLRQFPALQLEGVMSHLADADGTSEQTVAEAAAAFDACISQVLAAGFAPRFIHLAQTAGSQRAASTYANTMRLGIGLYGINPFPKSSPYYAGLTKLHPALRLISTVSRINLVERGEGVSYNYTFKAPRRMRLGVLPLGYYEGVPRILSNSGTVGYKKKYLPIVGRVCMNHTLVNLNGHDISVGDEVIVISDDPAAQNCVQALRETFSYEFLADLASDTRRVLVA